MVLTKFQKKKVRKAVIPVAGLGTRFLPATKAIPKEMIPIIDVPMIQYIVEEAVQSGIEEVIFVTSRHKGAIEDYFDANFELEERLRQRQKEDLLKLSKGTQPLCRLVSVRQGTPLGLGHAVLCAASLIGEEPFAVLLGDDLIETPSTPCTRQLIDVFDQQGSSHSVVAMMKVGTSQVSQYGILGGSLLSDRLMEVRCLVEKPAPSEAPSDWAIPGRYVLMPSIFSYLRETDPGKGGEIQLTDALQVMAQQEKVFGFQFQGLRYDTGDKMGYLEATLAFALKRQELSAPLLALMEAHLEAHSKQQRSSSSLEGRARNGEREHGA